MSNRWRMIALAGAAVLVVLSLTQHAQASTAAGEPPAAGPLARLVRGLKDVVLSPVEIPATMRRVAYEKDPFTGVWAGGLEGVGNGLSRLFAGVVEVVSSPVPGNTLPLYTKKLGERAAPPTGVPTGITRP